MRLGGVLNLEDQEPPTPAVLTRMITSLRHREPDEYGLVRDDRMGLAHARLSIIDLVTGQQPMTDGAVRLGRLQREIFNYIELRDELRACGRPFPHEQRHRGHRPGIS